MDGRHIENFVAYVFRVKRGWHNRGREPFARSMSGQEASVHCCALRINYGYAVTMQYSAHRKSNIGNEVIFGECAVARALP